MICYKDITFCKESTCKKFKECPRMFNEKVQEKAEKWWGSTPAPVCFFASEPRCFEKRKNKDG